MAQLWLDGVPPYTAAYDMRMPGIFAVYALILSVFGQSAWGIHVGLLIVHLASAWIVFALGREAGGFHRRLCRRGLLRRERAEPLDQRRRGQHRALRAAPGAGRIARSAAWAGVPPAPHAGRGGFAVRTRRGDEAERSRVRRLRGAPGGLACAGAAAGLPDRFRASARRSLRAARGVGKPRVVLVLDDDLPRQVPDGAPAPGRMAQLQQEPSPGRRLDARLLAAGGAGRVGAAAARASGLRARLPAGVAALLVPGGRAGLLLPVPAFPVARSRPSRCSPAWP